MARTIAKSAAQNDLSGNRPSGALWHHSHRWARREPHRWRNQMLDPQQIAERYIATWNETNAGKRSELLQGDCNGAASYADPMAKVSGREDIGGLNGGVQQRLPSFRFALTSAPNGYGEYIRFSWS